LEAFTRNDCGPGAITMKDPGRLVVIGSECTGKTTLARQLGVWLAAPVVPESARIYAESLSRELTSEDVEPIATGHLQSVALVIERHPAAHTLVLDTDLVSTVVYARHYYGSCPKWIEDEALARIGALYLLCATDIPWESDGVRDRAGARGAIHQSFVDVLRHVGAKVLTVDGLGPRRLLNAQAAVRGWRAAQPDQQESRPQSPQLG